jgi:hypothetical protein
LCWNTFYGAQIKPLQHTILIYSNQAEEFGFNFFTVNVSHIDGEHVAFWNSHHSFGRQMTERFMEYLNWENDGNV